MAKSTLTNPLANYRTYSYHHFFVICKDTATANMLAESTGIDMYQRPSSNRTLQNGSYVTVIDSRRDADFLIQELTIKNILVPPANCCSTAGSRLFGLEGEIKIFEPRGVSFLNLLVGATSAMGISPAVSSFVIKTIFIGHKEDGAQEVVGNIRPFVCTATDIMANVTEEGTTYSFKTMGNMDGRALQPEFNGVSEQTGIVVKKGEKLPEVLKKLTDAYNEKYSADAKAVGELIKDKGIDMNKITKVKYEVKLSPEKSTVLSQLDDFGTLIPETLKLGGQNGEAIIRGGPAGVHDHIHKIMTSSKKLNELVKGKIKGEQEAPQEAKKATTTVESDTAADQGTPPKEFITYKVRTLWENTAPAGAAPAGAAPAATAGGGETAGEIKVTYIIEEYKILQIEYKNELGQTKTSTTLPEDASVIEFDYIFTGKNTDVLDLDINMKYAFANWLNGGSRPQGGAQTQEMDVKGTSAGVQGASAYSAHPLSLNTPTGQPMAPAPFVGRKQTTSPQTNQHTGEIITPLSTEAMWRWHSAMEQLQTKMTIHGNPILLEQMAFPGGGSSEGWSFRWTNVPAYAKVNIKFPKYKYDIWETGPQYPADYFEDFWYQDYYQILFVNNIFSGGIFTQELEMISMIQTSESSTDRKQPTGAVASGGATGTPASAGKVPKNLGDSKNAEKSMQYLISKGYTPAQAAGIVGNLQAESGQKLNTGAVGDGGKALGIAQWHPDRQKGLMNYASQTGKDPYALETQLDWVDIEIKGQDAQYNGGSRNGGKNTYSALMNSTTPEQAAYAIQKYYERCKVCGDGYLLNDRKAYTNNVYNRYGNSTAAASTTAQTQQPVQATQQTVADATVAQKTPS